MMKRFSSLCFTLLFSTIVQAAVPGEQVEELSYDDLVQELSTYQQRTQVRRDGSSAFDDVRIHAGLGLVNSFSTFQVGDRKMSRAQNGMQLSLGVDLFSEHWMAEVAWRNFGQTRTRQEEHYLRELDLKFIHRAPIDAHWDYRLQGGLAQRQLRLSDESGTEINDDTPALLGAVGAVIQMTPAASINFDAGVRTPVIGRTADKGSIDLSLEFKFSL